MDHEKRADEPTVECDGYGAQDCTGRSVETIDGDRLCAPCAGLARLAAAHDTTLAELLDARRERDEARRELRAILIATAARVGVSASAAVHAVLDDRAACVVERDAALSALTIARSPWKRGISPLEYIAELRFKHKRHNAETHEQIQNLLSQRDAARVELASARASSTAAERERCAAQVELIGGLSAKLKVDPYAWGKSVAAHLRSGTDGAASAVEKPHRHCGCGGLCDTGEPCPMSYNCPCRSTVTP